MNREKRPQLQIIKRDSSRDRIDEANAVVHKIFLPLNQNHKSRKTVQVTLTRGQSSPNLQKTNALSDIDQTSLRNGKNKKLEAEDA